MAVIALREGLDMKRCFVRMRNVRADGFVEFDFSIGDPELSVELILPQGAYKEFCAVNKVTQLTSAQGELIDQEKLKWRYGKPGVSE